jgi:hypothetical protein
MIPILEIVAVIIITLFLVSNFGYDLYQSFGPCKPKDINCTHDCQCIDGYCASANGVNQCCKYIVRTKEGKQYCL